MHPHQLTVVLAVMFMLSLASAQQSVVIPTTVIVYDVLPAISTSTAYATNVVTVLGCPPWEKNCPVRHSVAVVTATLALSTTACPLTMTNTRLSSFDHQVLLTQSPAVPDPFSTTTTTWPGTLTLSGGLTEGADDPGASSSSYDIPTSVWGAMYSSLFPTGGPGVLTSAGMTFTFYGSSASPTPSDTSSYTSIDSLSTRLTWSTSVSIHESVTTVPNPPPTETLSMGSLTAIIPMNTTSVIPAYVPYPLISSGILPPNVSFKPTGSWNSSMANATATWYMNSGTGATYSLFSVFVALLAATLIL